MKQGPNQNVIAKDAPIIPIRQEITGALGALCQGLEIKTRYMLFSYVTCRVDGGQLILMRMSQDFGEQRKGLERGP